MGLTVWLILTMILIMVEIISLGLTSIWFAGGAFVAGLISLTGAHWLIQILTFAVVSTILFVFTRPFAAKHLLRHVEKTNVDSLIGKEGIVKETINNFDSHGIVRISGMEWTARSADNTKIPAGETVTVQKISGVKLIVTKSYQTDKTYPVLQDFCNMLKEQPEAESKELMENKYNHALHEFEDCIDDYGKGKERYLTKNEFILYNCILTCFITKLEEQTENLETLTSAQAL